MKKLLLASSLIISLAAYSQSFWTETFGSGCNKGTVASSYTGSNGTWTISSTGTNDQYADQWFVSATANNTGVGNCNSNCSNSNNPTLHVGNAAFTLFSITQGADSTCTYLTGVFCGQSICSTTHRRAESPTINCTGKNGISMSFIYLEGGQTTLDNATVWYNDGATWTQLSDPAKTNNANCNGAGQWTNYMVALPASANNNPNVKIGFNWTNNNDGQGSDPSFAVDNITLSVVTGIDAQNLAANLEVYPNPFSDKTTLILRDALLQSSANVLTIYNMQGEAVRQSRFDAPSIELNRGELQSGIYFYELKDDSRVKARGKLVIE